VFSGTLVGVDVAGANMGPVLGMLVEVEVSSGVVGARVG